MKLVYFPDFILKKKLKPVTSFDSVLSKQTKEMFKLMKQEKGIGLAANQVNIDKSMFVMWIKENKKETKRVFINPSLKLSGDLIYNKEGCLSFPEITVEMGRFPVCEITYQNLFGIECKEIFTGLPAIVCQHEYDHLIGKTFIDLLPQLTKDEISAKLLSK